jgi:DNA-binding transcriptional LysR family regulator
MESLRGMVSFVETARRGSFVGAAQVLGISSVAVSRNVSRLEAQLKVQLFVRSTRQLTLTARGTELLSRCEAPLEQLSAAFSGSRDASDAMAGVVRVTAVSPFVRAYLAPRLAEFHATHPKIELEVLCNEQVSDLAAEKLDVGIRVGPLDDAAFVARPIGPLELVLCASPGFVAARGVRLAEQGPQGLARGEALGLLRPGDNVPVPWWLQGPQGVQTLPVAGPLRSNDFMSLAAACSAGLGVAQLPLVMVLPELRAGALRVLWPERCPQGLQLFIHYPSRQLPARVRAFVDFVLQTSRSHQDLAETARQYAVETPLRPHPGPGDTPSTRARRPRTAG